MLGQSKHIVVLVFVVVGVVSYSSWPLITRRRPSSSFSSLSSLSASLASAASFLSQVLAVVGVCILGAMVKYSKCIKQKEHHSDVAETLPRQAMPKSAVAETLPRQAMPKSAVAEETNALSAGELRRLKRKRSQLCHICGGPPKFKCEGCENFMCPEHMGQRCDKLNELQPLCPGCHVDMWGYNMQICYLCDEPSQIDCTICEHYICKHHTAKCTVEECSSPLCPICTPLLDGECKPYCNGYD